MTWLVNISTPLSFRNIDHELNFTKHIVKNSMFFTQHVTRLVCLESRTAQGFVIGLEVVFIHNDLRLEH